MTINISKRITSSVLALFLCITLLSGCADTSVKPSDTIAGDTAAEETEEARLFPDLPEMTYDGYNYRFYSYEVEHYMVMKDIAVDDIDGEIINDSIYKRNDIIGAKYDISISVKYDYYITYEANVNKNNRAGDDYADILLSMGHNIPRMYSQNVFFNLHNVPYLEFDMPWWDSNAVESFTLVGYMPFGVSDLTLLDKGVTSCVYFNKQIAEDFTLGNLYDLVYKNEWVFDQLIVLGKKVTTDLNGDSKYDENDLFGIVCDDDPVFMLFNGGGGRHITKDTEGYPELSFNTERNFTMIVWYLENIMYDEMLTYNSSYTPSIKQHIDMFADNQGLFLFRALNAAIKLRTMKTDFGILPIPKYEATQKDYGNAVSVFGTNLISVPLTAGDRERTGIILEALSAESRYTVIPAFYDIVLKDKFTRDAESTDMLDIIVNSRVYDVGDYYGLAAFPDNFLRITGKAAHLTGIQKTSDIASFYAKREKAIIKALNDLIKVIDKWHELELK